MTARKWAVHSVTLLSFLALAGSLLSAHTAAATQVCGCKKTNGKVIRLVSPGPPTCTGTKTPICWNEALDIGVGVYDNSTPSVPGDASYFNVPFTQEAWDPANMHDEIGAPTDLVAPVAGRYLVTAAVGFSETATPVNPAFNLRELIIRNGDGDVFGQIIRNATVSTPVEETMMSTSAILDLAAGEIVHVTVTQSSGGPLNLYPRFQAQMQKLN